MQEQVQLRARCVHPLGGHRPFRLTDLEQPVHERFERIAREHAERPAIETGEGTWTYRELDHAANKIAHAVAARMGAQPQPVGLLFEHGAEAIASLMGVLKAGHIYLPLDPEEPRLRLRRILEQSGAQLVITRFKNLDAAATACGGHAALLDVDDLSDAGADAPPAARVGPESPASLYYTSGSTGVPKGVLSTHRTRMLNAMRNTNALHISPEDRLSLLYASRYAGAVNCTFGALLNGAVLLPFDLGARGAVELGRWLLERRITILHTVPAVYRQMAANSDAGAEFPDLRLILLASDSVYPADVEIFREHFPRSCLLANAWGVSESPLFRPFFFSHDSREWDGGAPSVGWLDEQNGEEDEVLLLDESGAVVEGGGAGEIILRSRDLAVGYWREPAQTAERFQPAPGESGYRLYRTGDLGRRRPDGALVHLGRKDLQVQIGGQRVEIAEIETVLLSHPDVRAAAVAASKTKSGDTRLVAYLECSRRPPSETELRRYLADRLPPQMLPDRIVYLDGLPLTSANKIDRLALPAQPNERPEMETAFEGPRSPLEAEVAAIFENVLELSGIGVHDSFLELGGKSLGAMEILTKVAAKYGLRMTPEEFFGAPTPAAAAQRIEASRAGAAEPNAIEDLLAELESLSEAEAQRLLDEREGGLNTPN